MKKNLFFTAVLGLCLFAGMYANAERSKDHPRWGRCFHGAACHANHDSDRRRALEGCEKGDKHCYKFQEEFLEFMAKNSLRKASSPKQSQKEINELTNELTNVVGLLRKHRENPEESQKEVTEAIKKEVEKQEERDPAFLKNGCGGSLPFSSCYR